MQRTSSFPNNLRPYVPKPLPRAMGSATFGFLVLFWTTRDFLHFLTNDTHKPRVFKKCRPYVPKPSRSAVLLFLFVGLVLLDNSRFFAFVITGHRICSFDLCSLCLENLRNVSPSATECLQLCDLRSQRPKIWH